MSAFISVSTRSAFAAAFCNADFAFETKEEDSISQLDGLTSIFTTS
jgi:hypothetical protein